MTDWSTGYVVDLGYTYGYYAELNPRRMQLAFLNAGLAAPQVRTACELGFGQGMSTNIHAACSGTEWWGTDFNPAQAAFAREVAAASRADVRLYDESFAEFCARGDLPEFDYVGLHGIWSWISDENRTVLVDFLRRKLKVGGVLYISYNTMPGWAAMVPLRHLLTEHAEVMAAPGRGTVARIDAALEFAERLLATNPLAVRAQPQIAERIKLLKGQNRHYLAHEYFNRDWEPMPIAEMGRWLGDAKLSYACSAHYADHVEEVNLLPEQQAFLGEIPDPMFRETTRDFMVNQQFRRDYWVKGARRLTPLEQEESLRSLRFILVEERAGVSLKTKGALGEATLQEQVYGPILDRFAEHLPLTIGELEQRLRLQNVPLRTLVQTILVLANNGVLHAVQEDAACEAAGPTTSRLNQFVLEKARGSGELGYLGSPVSGGAIAVSRVQQLFLLARGQGRSKPAEWADFCWQLLATQGHRLLKDGKVIDDPAGNLAELTREATEFERRKLPILKALSIV